MFDPSIGRWLEEDPDGFNAGDPNLDRYCDNSPMDATDPTGMFPVSIALQTPPQEPADFRTPEQKAADAAKMAAAEAEYQREIAIDRAHKEWLEKQKTLPKTDVPSAPSKIDHPLPPSISVDFNTKPADLKAFFSKVAKAAFLRGDVGKPTGDNDPDAAIAAFNHLLDLAELTPLSGVIDCCVKWSNEVWNEYTETPVKLLTAGGYYFQREIVKWKSYNTGVDHQAIKITITASEPKVVFYLDNARFGGISTQGTSRIFGPSDIPSSYQDKNEYQREHGVGSEPPHAFTDFWEKSGDWVLSKTRQQFAEHGQRANK